MKTRRWLTGSIIAGLALTAGAAVPAVAADSPPNPEVKPGWTLDFQEEFNGTALDSTKWLPYYLPHWTHNRENAKGRYSIADGVLTQRIDQDQQPWDALEEGQLKSSALQTYNAPSWHNYRGGLQNHSTEPVFDGYSTTYGYFELRAKLTDTGGGGHNALWFVGTNQGSQSEIDMLETFFSTPKVWRIAAFGWGDPEFIGAWDGIEVPVTGEPTKEFHTYGMEWSPTQLKFYYDNQLWYTINDAPNKPMGMILNIYTNAGSGAQNEVWPKSWQVDYLRVWKPNGGWSAASNHYDRIQSTWTGDVLHVQPNDGKVRAGKVPDTYWSSQWIREKVGDYTRYRNRWTGQYLDSLNADGQARAVDAPPNWWSSQWTEQLVANSDVYHLVNRNSGQAVHIQDRNGYAQLATIPTTWHSSWWRFVDAPNN